MHCPGVAAAAIYIASYIPWALIDNHVLFAGWPAGHTGQTLVDLTATGSTLRENGLVVREEIAECTARLIANPVAHKLKARALDKLLERLDAV